MNTQNLIDQHKQELNFLKAQMYDAEKRLLELASILAALERVKQLEESNKTEE